MTHFFLLLLDEITQMDPCDAHRVGLQGMQKQLASDTHASKVCADGL
jgi:hypothetical protein